MMGSDCKKNNSAINNADPRLCFIGHNALVPRSSIGVTFSSLLGKWPPDRLAQVNADIEEPSQELCNVAWRLSSTDIPLDRIVRGMLQTLSPGLLGENSQAPLTMREEKGEGFKKLVRSTLRAWADMFAYRLRTDFWSWLDRFSPEVILSPLGSIRIMKLVLSIAQRCQAPIVPFFCDDWPNTYYTGSLWTSVPRTVLKRELRAIIRRSPIGMGGSVAMARELQSRFKIPFEGFMNCTPISTAFPAPSPSAQARPVRFIYVGGLHLNRWQSLRDIGECLLALKESRIDAEAVIHAPDADIAMYGHALPLPPVMRTEGYLAYDQV
jgi:hypothetical protein